MDVRTVSSRWWVSCGGTIDQGPIPPNTDGAAAVEYGLDHGARLNVEFQQGCREFLLESGPQRR